MNMFYEPVTALTLYDDDILMIILFQLLVSYIVHSSQKSLDFSTHQSHKFFGQFKFVGEIPDKG